MEEEQGRIVSAIRRLREQVRWKPGKDNAHLLKRVALGHLPIGASVADYEALIQHIISIPTVEVFVYTWDDTIYPTVVAKAEGTHWLIMMSLDGVMETAFPPEEPDAYLADPRFRRLGTLKELGL